MVKPQAIKSAQAGELPSPCGHYWNLPEGLLLEQPNGQYEWLKDGQFVPYQPQPEPKPQWEPLRNEDFHTAEVSPTVHSHLNHLSCIVGPPQSMPSYSVQPGMDLLEKMSIGDNPSLADSIITGGEAILSVRLIDVKSEKQPVSSKSHSHRPHHQRSRSHRRSSHRNPSGSKLSGHKSTGSTNKSSDSVYISAVSTLGPGSKDKPSGSKQGSVGSKHSSRGSKHHRSSGSTQTSQSSVKFNNQQLPKSSQIPRRLSSGSQDESGAQPGRFSSPTHNCRINQIPLKKTTEFKAKGNKGKSRPHGHKSDLLKVTAIKEAVANSHHSEPSSQHVKIVKRPKIIPVAPVERKQSGEITVASNEESK